MWIHSPVVFQCWLLSLAAELLLPAMVCHQAPENREPKQCWPQTFCNLLFVVQRTHGEPITPAAEVSSLLLTWRSVPLLVEPHENIHSASRGEEGRLCMRSVLPAS